MTTIISADNGTVSGSAGLKSTADSSGILAFQTGANTTAVTIDASQNVKFSNNISVGGATPTTSGSGITFPATQSASSEANTLDDYEEGNWTPTLNYGWTITGTVTPTGTYTRIGRQIFLTIKITASGGGSVSMNLANITGLPFTAANSALGAWGVVSNYGATTQTQNVLVDGSVIYLTGAWTGVANYVYAISVTYTV
jgi:hypothetical protein